MKYIAHIKELVSGIIDNETVTRDTEAYNALVALKNHLDSLEEVQKYMPYKDPGPVIRNLEQSLARATTKYEALEQKYQEQKKVIEKLNKENADYRDILDRKYILDHGYITLDRKDQANKEPKQSQSQITNLKEDLKKQTQISSQKQEEISFLIGILSEEQLEEYQEYLRTQLPDDQPNY